MAKLSRRDLLTRLGLAFGGGVAGACAPGVDPYDLAPTTDLRPKGWQVGKEEWVPTSCGQCPAGCGVKARVFEGRVVKLEGNVECAINEGGIGPRGTCGTQVLYDPDRLTQPLKRTGPRGSPSFEAISWQDATQLVVARLGGLRSGGKAHELAVVCGRERGMMLDLFQRFGAAFGTPNLFDGSSTAGGAASAALFAMQGVRELPAYDWPRARYVLSFGSGLLGSACQMTWFTRGGGALSTWRGQVRPKIVHLEPYRSQTGSNADEWICINPGSYGALALALGHVLVRDGLYDRAFVDAQTFGFEPWVDLEGRQHKGLRAVLDAHSPEQVSPICGVSVETIERLAAELAAHRPSFAIAGDLATQASNGVATAMAIHSLNALLGAIERPGGVLVQRQPPLAAWPDLELDPVAQAGLATGRIDGAGAGRFPLATSALDALPAAISAGASVDSLLLYYANPLYSRNDPSAWRAALSKVPFVVSFSPFMDETAAEAADLILPDATYLERWEDAAPAPSLGFPVFGVRRPVIDPLYDTRNTGDVILEIAAALPELEGALPWKDFKAVVLGGLRTAEGKAMQKPVVQTGFWSGDPVEPEQWSEAFNTPSGKLELYSQALATRLAGGAAPSPQGDGPPDAQADAEGETPTPVGAPGAVAGLPGPDADDRVLPGYVPPVWEGDDTRFPLMLHPFRFNTYAEGSGANLPWLQEIPMSLDFEPWQTQAMMHPDAAAARGIRAGDVVEVSSPRGSVQVPVRLHSGIHPAVVAIPQGGGHTAFGRYASGWGANVKALLGTAALEPLAGVTPTTGTRVQVTRVAS